MASNRFASNFPPRTTEKNTLEHERANSTFKACDMEVLIDGSPALTKLKREIHDLISADPLLNDKFQTYNMSVEEQRYLCTKKIFRVADLMNSASSFEWKKAFLSELNNFDPALGIRYFVQYGLWIGTIENMGTESQKSKWLDGAPEMKIIGSFGMTELGHSSFLRGSETLVTFDKKADEFIVHTSSLIATKWWIGQAGQIATHCIVFGNLQIDGKSHGIQLFIVPIRNPVTGQPCPGVTIGDIGPKYGRNGNDNGYISFQNVRIPRENMLAKWAQVSRDGVFTPPPNPALAYSSTILERVGSVAGSIAFSRNALTIATRFAAVRRQGSIGTPEPQILSYPIHQSRLIPHIARLYATAFSARNLEARYQNVVTMLKEGDTSSLDFLVPLADIHNLACGLKVFGVFGELHVIDCKSEWDATSCTWWTSKTLEDARRTLGGHGYSVYSGIPSLLQDFGVLTTGGGDNFVIAQQNGVYLAKVVSLAKKGQKIPTSTSASYFSNTKSYLLKEPFVIANYMDLNRLSEALKTLAVKMADALAKVHLDSVASGRTTRESWVDNMVQVIDVSEMHCNTYLFDTFLSEINIRNPPQHIKTVLLRLCHLFGLKVIQNRMSWFLEFGLVNTAHIDFIKREILMACKELRPNAVVLMDSFGLSDDILRAPLGCYDGDIYERYYEAALSSRVNQTQVAPYWDELVSPRTKLQSQSKL